MTLTHLSLFSGIGGCDIAAEWAGFETVCFVENNDYCRKVLAKNFPETPIIGDIRDVTKETITNAAKCDGQCNGSNIGGKKQVGVGCNARYGGGTNTDRPITLITGGFPCQPVSVAGKRRGKEDDRWLWPEMLRVISEVRPTWVVAENVAGLIRMGLDGCISDLEGEGFEVQTFLIPACAVNAPHRRDRIFIVAWNSNIRDRNKGTEQGMDQGQDTQSPRVCTDVANTDTERPQGHGGLRECGGQWLTWSGSEPLEGIWESEPPVGRVASRISKRVDRLKALGNAVVPQQIYPILQAIADIEKQGLRFTPNPCSSLR